MGVPVHVQYPYKIDPAALLEQFGGAAGAVSALASVGVRVKVKTVQKWKARGYMPSDGVAGLLLAAEKEGKPLNLLDFVTERGTEGAEPT